MKENDYGLPIGKVFFTLTEIEEIGLMSKVKLKLEIYKGKLKSIKAGRNHRVSRPDLIAYIDTHMVQQ